MDGVADPVTIFIHISLRNAAPLGKVVLYKLLHILYILHGPLAVTAQAAPIQATPTTQVPPTAPAAAISKGMLHCIIILINIIV